jgi:hypothetical protein
MRKERKARRSPRRVRKEKAGRGPSGKQALEGDRPIGPALFAARDANEARRIMDHFVASQKNQTFYTHPPRPASAYFKLKERLADLSLFPSPTDKAKVGVYLAAIGATLRLPRIYDFYPRNSVPAGAKGYEEEWHRVESFPVPSMFEPPSASGFGSFNPNTGQFQIVTISRGSDGQVSVGPIIMIETDDAADVTLTANLSVDLQYNLSNSPNPVHPNGNYLGFAETLTWVKAEASSGPWIPAPRQYLRYVVLKPRSPGDPSVWIDPDGGQHYYGSSHQSGEAGWPIVYKADFPLPAKTTSQIALFLGAMSYGAGGAEVSKDHHSYISYAETRVSGVFSSIRAEVYT